MKITIEKEEVLELVKEAVSEKYGMEAVSCVWGDYSSGDDIKISLKKKGEKNANGNS